jgi:hypothetical protein
MRRAAATLVALACLVAMSLLEGCSSNKSKSVAAQKTSTSASGPSTTAVPAGVAPLTGLPGDPAKVDRPALIVKIDNAPKARPQAGINKADVVVEEMVEGGITRLASVFQSTDSTVEPVRSARSTDIAFASALHKPLFAYSGANPTFLSLVRSAPLVDVGVDKFSSAYHRDASRPMPYNLVSSTTALYGGAPSSSKAPPALWLFTGGMVFKGRWSKPAASAVTTYTDASGEPMKLTPGRTWVELTPSNGKGSASAL